jgi:hypothetical protein
MKKIFSLPVLLLLISSLTYGQNSLTDLLTKQFHQAWNKENINEMVSLLQANAFYQSSQQLQYGRDKMKATVLKTNPHIYKVVNAKELHSFVEDHLAWSIGEYTFDVYDEYGNKTNKQLKGTYTYVFTKRNNEDWKVQMLIYHE